MNARRTSRLILSTLVLVSTAAVMPNAAHASTCTAQASVSLYRDAAHSQLVDSFDVSNAPASDVFSTQKRHSSDDLFFETVVTGSVTGSAYLFSVDLRSGGTFSTSFNLPSRFSITWLVRGASGGIVAMSAQRDVLLSKNFVTIFDNSVGSGDHGLYLVGQFEIDCQ